MTQPTSRAGTFGAILRVTSGNFLEQFDFFLFGFYATYIARTFFPAESEFAALMLTFAVFGSGFLMRPIGAVVLGAYIDRIGRRKGLMVTLAIMGCGTLLIALVPGYQTIGVLAPVLVLIGRLLQGFSAGVELGGVSVYLSEIAKPGKKGFYTSWQSASQQVAIVMAALIGYALNETLGHDEIAEWGWRIPFFLAIPMGIVALWLRVKMEETPGFLRQQQTTPPAETRASWRQTLKAIFTGIGRLMVWSAAGYTYLVIMPSYLQSALHTGFNQALLIAVISNIGFAITILPAGMLSDKLGRRRVMVAAAVLLLVLALPLLKILQAESSTLLVKGIVVLIAGGLVGILAGPGPAMLAEMFPTRVRYTGLGLAYSLSNAVFSGCAGLIITGLIKQTGNLDIPAYYVMATAVVSIAALMTLNKNDHLRALDD